MEPRTILIADDDPDVLSALSIRLTHAGYTVLKAVDSYQAVQLAQQHAPDLAILDINMPAGDGFSVQERTQKIAALGNMPVIYLTGDTSQATKDLARAMKAFALVHKPFEPTEFLATIESALAASPTVR